MFEIRKSIKMNYSLNRFIGLLDIKRKCINLEIKLNKLPRMKDSKTKSTTYYKTILRDMEIKL